MKILKQRYWIFITKPSKKINCPKALKKTVPAAFASYTLKLIISCILVVILFCDSSKTKIFLFHCFCGTSTTILFTLSCGWCFTNNKKGNFSFLSEHKLGRIGHGLFGKSQQHLFNWAFDVLKMLYSISGCYFLKYHFPLFAGFPHHHLSQDPPESHAIKAPMAPDLLLIAP